MLVLAELVIELRKISFFQPKKNVNCEYQNLPQETADKLNKFKQQ